MFVSVAGGVVRFLPLSPRIKHDYFAGKRGIIGGRKMLALRECNGAKRFDALIAEKKSE